MASQEDFDRLETVLRQCQTRLRGIHNSTYDANADPIHEHYGFFTAAEPLPMMLNSFLDGAENSSDPDMVKIRGGAAVLWAPRGFTDRLPDLLYALRQSDAFFAEHGYAPWAGSPTEFARLHNDLTAALQRFGIAIPPLPLSHEGIDRQLAHFAELYRPEEHAGMFGADVTDPLATIDPMGTWGTPDTGIPAPIQDIRYHNWDYFIESQVLLDLLVPLAERLSPQDAATLRQAFGGPDRAETEYQYRSGSFGTTPFMLSPGINLHPATHELLVEAQRRLMQYGENLMAERYFTPAEFIAFMNQSSHDPKRWQALGLDAVAEDLIMKQRAFNETEASQQPSVESHTRQADWEAFSETWTSSVPPFPDTARPIHDRLMAAALNIPVTGDIRERFYGTRNLALRGLEIHDDVGNPLLNQEILHNHPPAVEAAFVAAYLAIVPTIPQGATEEERLDILRRRLMPFAQEPEQFGREFQERAFQKER